MTALEIKKYIQKHRRVTVSELAFTFKIDAHLIIKMLNKYMSQGKLTIQAVEKNCSQCAVKCNGCSSINKDSVTNVISAPKIKQELYVWIEK